MESRISTTSRPDVVLIETSPRPTAAPVRVSFGQVLADGAFTLVQGAEIAGAHLPGSPIAAAAVRAYAGGGALDPASSRAGGAALSTQPEGPAPQSPASPMVPGPAAVGMAMGAATPSGADPSAAIDQSMQQSAQLNLYYLQVQQQVDAQNRAFTALSNVLKTEHDSAKAAIQNIHS